MNKIYLLAFLMILGFGESYAQKKIGIVDVQRVMDSLPSRRVAIGEIRELERLALQEMQVMDSLLAVKIDEKEAGTSTEEDVQRLRDRIAQRENDIVALFAQMATECDQKSRQEIATAMTKVAEKMKLAEIYDKANFVYSKKTVDVTEEVIAEVKKTQ